MLCNAYQQKWLRGKQINEQLIKEVCVSFGGSLLFDQVFILLGSFQIQSLQRNVSIFILGSLCNKGCLHSGTFYFHQDFVIYPHKCYKGR